MTENELTIDALVTIVRGQLQGAAFQTNLAPGYKPCFGKDESPYLAMRLHERDQKAGYHDPLTKLTKENVWIFVVPEPVDTPPLP